MVILMCSNSATGITFYILSTRDPSQKSIFIIIDFNLQKYLKHQIHHKLISGDGGKRTHP